MGLESGLYALDPGHAVKARIEADDLRELELPHEYGVIGVGERDVEVGVEIEDLAEAALARKNDPRQLYQGEKTIPNFASGYPVLPLKGEDRLEDNRVGQPDLDLAALNPGEKGRGSWRLFLVVLEKVTQDDVCVEKPYRHLLLGPLDSLLRDSLFGCFPQLLRC